MKIHLIAMGKRMPDWVSQGYTEYAKRMPNDCSLHLVEIATEKDSKGMDLGRKLRIEGERMLSHLPEQSYVIALNVTGITWDTITLAKQLQTWREKYRNIALLIGGADGLSPACLARANQHWSLSPLTLPHPLVRIIVAEQIYRAWSIRQQHPYHRD